MSSMHIWYPLYPNQMCNYLHLIFFLIPLSLPHSSTQPCYPASFLPSSPLYIETFVPKGAAGGASGAATTGGGVQGAAKLAGI
jgi:hypothetical protein